MLPLQLMKTTKTCSSAKESLEEKEMDEAYVHQAKEKAARRIHAARTEISCNAFATMANAGVNTTSSEIVLMSEETVG